MSVFKDGAYYPLGTGEEMSEGEYEYQYQMVQDAGERDFSDEMDRFDRVGTGASEAWKARMQAYDRPGFMDQFSRESYRQPPRKLVKRKVAVDESGMSKKEKKKAARERKKADKAEKKAEAKRAKDKAEVRLKAMGLHVHKG